MKKQIDRWIEDNPRLSYLTSHVSGHFCGFNLGYHLSKGNRLYREVNGVALGIGTSLLFDLGLYTYKKYYLEEQEKPDNNDIKPEQNDSSKKQNQKSNKDNDIFSDNAEFIIEMLNLTDSTGSS